MSINNENKKYVLSGKRQITRILDTGLIIPELVACNSAQQIFTFDDDSLSSINNIPGTPATPVLIEIRTTENIPQSVIAADEIVAIHFPSAEEREDYIDRAFENVPNELFTITDTPELFSSQGNQVTGLTFPKLDKKAIYAKYRRIDMALGLMKEALVSLNDSHDVRSLISYFTHFNPCKEDSGQPYAALIKKASGVEVEESINLILSDYFSVIEDYSIENGWASKKILLELKKLYENHPSSESIFEKWYNISSAIINNEIELFPLTDERSIILRSILLHLINPDENSISRFSKKTPNLGIKVLLVANLISATREGYSGMIAEEKTKRSGIFFLLSSMASSWVNNTELNFDKLQTENKGDLEALAWNNFTIGEYKLPITDVSDEKPITENQIIEKDIQHLEKVLKDISIIKSINKENDEKLVFTLDGKLLKPISIPMKAEFSTQIINNNVVLKTGILDLNVKSQLKKLTGPRMKSAFKYQGEQKSNFRFFMEEDAAFKAEISTPLPEVSTSILEGLLQELISAHTWMKNKAT